MLNIENELHKDQLEFYTTGKAVYKQLSESLMYMLGRNIMYKFLLLFLCFLICCSDNDFDIDRSTGVIPLAIDNIWNYESWIFDSTGASYQLASPYSKVTGCVTINEERWFTLENRWVSGGTSHDTCINQPTGYFRYWQGLTSMVYKYPASVNEEYTFEYFHIDSLYKLKRELTSLDTIIITPSGTFSCIQYYSPRLIISPYGEFLETDYFIDRSVGIVKWIHYRTTPSGKRYIGNVNVLSSYILN